MHRHARAFSLIELVIVVVIIGIVAAIAVPRLSRGVSGSRDAQLTGDLNALRRAIELYRAEHSNEAPKLVNVVGALLRYTNDGGHVDTTRSNSHRWGPYLRKIPELSVGANRGSAVIGGAPGGGVAWVYDEDTGEIRAGTTTEADESGTPYNTY